MADATTFVGLDVHVETIAIAAARGDGAPEDLGTIPNTADALAKRLRRLGDPASLRVCYEAGPCGYGIHRQLTARGIACVVVAPSLIPTRPGDRVKTDRRDAAKLARLLRSGDLTPIAVPTPAQEALRALSRAREAAKGDLHRLRQRLLKLLAQRGVAAPPGARWTKAWGAWLDAVALPEPLDQLVLADLRAAIAAAQARLDRLTAELTAAAPAQGPVVAALQLLHGVGPLTAVGIVAEVGDLTRFDRAPQLFAYAGLVPGEHSSGARQHRGGITKTGNAHLRALLVEAAWHCVRPPKPAPAPTSALEQIAADARARLHARFWRLVSRGKSRQTAIVAVARELLGFVWAMARAATRLAQEVPLADAA